MDIDIRKIATTRPTGVTPSRHHGAGEIAASQGGKGTAGVSVSLTEAASLLQSAEETARREPVVDAARVAALKEAIASGRYHVDAARVAAKFLSLEKDL